MGFLERLFARMIGYAVSASPVMLGAEWYDVCAALC
jgi:hypothetical protein